MTTTQAQNVRDGDGNADGGGRYVVGGTGWNHHKALYWRDNWPNGQFSGPDAIQDPLFHVEYHTMDMATVAGPGGHLFGGGWHMRTNQATNRPTPLLVLPSAGRPRYLEKGVPWNLESSTIFEFPDS